jgi:hypothetical protein
MTRKVAAGLASALIARARAIGLNTHTEDVRNLIGRNRPCRARPRPHTHLIRLDAVAPARRQSLLELMRRQPRPCAQKADVEGLHAPRQEADQMLQDQLRCRTVLSAPSAEHAGRSSRNCKAGKKR